MTWILSCMSGSKSSSKGKYFWNMPKFTWKHFSSRKMRPFTWAMKGGMRRKIHAIYLFFYVFPWKWIVCRLQNFEKCVHPSFGIELRQQIDGWKCAHNFIVHLSFWWKYTQVKMWRAYLLGCESKTETHTMRTKQTKYECGKKTWRGI